MNSSIGLILLRCVWILLCLCTLFSQVVSFLHMFISKFVCVSHVDHVCISYRPRVLTCRTRLILPGLITAFIEYGEQVVLLSTLMYFPVSFSHKYNMQEDFQYRNCSVIRNHYMCKVSLRTHFDKWHIKLRIWAGRGGSEWIDTRVVDWSTWERQAASLLLSAWTFPLLYRICVCN